MKGDDRGTEQSPQRLEHRPTVESLDHIDAQALQPSGRGSAGPIIINADNIPMA